MNELNLWIYDEVFNYIIFDWGYINNYKATDTIYTYTADNKIKRSVCAKGMFLECI
jgi:hypothetical protein